MPPAVLDALAAFLTRRLEQALTDEGRPVKHIRAALGHAARPARTDAILAQLAALAGTPEFDRLVQTMQRVRRIVPPGTAPYYDPGVLVEPAEIRLHETLGTIRFAVEGITDLARYTDATTELAHAVSEFFDKVYVMDGHPQRRATRRGLLAAITEFGEQTLAWEHLHG